MNGWLFLIARGRRRGYRTLLAPDFLVAAGDYGAIEAAVRPTGAAGLVDMTTVTTRACRDLTVAYTTHVVTAADLAETGMLPRDEHSRPLTLLYGYICEAPWTPNPTRDELRAAREQALDVYRRFLADEDGTTVSASRPQQVQTYARQAPPEPTPAGRTPRSSGVSWNLAIVALVAAIATVVAIMWFGRSDEPDIPGKDDCLTSAYQAVDCADAAAMFTVSGSVDGKTKKDFDADRAKMCAANTKPIFWPTGQDDSLGAVLCLAERT